MQQVGDSNKTPVSVIVPHYLTAAFSFLLLSILLFLSTSSLTGHYFQPRLLALTHLAALGWGTMIILGALYQFLPVMLDTRLYSFRLAYLTFLLLLPGVACMILGFWDFRIGTLLQTGGLLVLAALSIFTFNVYRTTRRAKVWSIEADFILTSCIWLLSTALIGAVLIFNLSYAFLPEDHLLYLKLHAHLGIAGWFIMLITGVASKLLPMFMISGKQGKKKLNIAFYLMNGGLAAFTFDIFFTGGSTWQPLYLILSGLGILSFLLYVRDAYKSRMRQVLDAGMKQSLLALMLIILPLTLALFLSVSGEQSTGERLYSAYGVSIFLGFITALILGQTFKTLPFMVWLKLKENSTSRPGLLPKDLFSERLVKYQSWLYIIAFALLMSGMLSGQRFLLSAGSLSMILTALLYVSHVSKVMLHMLHAKATRP